MPGPALALRCFMRAEGSLLGRVIVGFSVFASTEFPPFVWFNGDHAASPAWPIHAKFHITWNAVVLMAIGGLGLYAIAAHWQKEPKIRAAVTVLPVLLSVAYMVAGLVVAPAVLGVPDAYAERTPIVVFGHHTQFEGWFLLMALGVGGYLLDRRARAKAL